MYALILEEKSDILHYGTPRHSGRYPWGSGERPYQSNLGFKNLKNSKSKNLDSWGKSPDKNVLYITGISGSGKSTTANSIANKNDIVIHLDSYAEYNNRNFQNKRFNDFLNKTFPEYSKITNAQKSGLFGSKQYWELVDKFRDKIEQFGKEMFESNDRVIVEGVQIGDNWLAEPGNFYRDKPIIILNTDKEVSINRAILRDDIKTEYVEDLIKRIDTYSESLSTFSVNNQILEGIGRDEIERLLKT